MTADVLVTTFLVLVIVFLTIASGFFSASEIALFSLPSLKVRSYKTSPDPRRHLVAHLLTHPRDLLITIFIFNTLVNIVLQNIISGMAGEEAGWLVKAGLPIAIVLVLGEVVPKYLGMIDNVKIADSVAGTVDYLQRLCGPLRHILNLITTPLSRMLFFFLKDEQEITREELDHVLMQSQKAGIIVPDEALLIQGYLNLREARVKEVMRPREEIIAYSIEQPLEALVRCFVEQECSRVPVYCDALDDIMGIMSARHFFIHRNAIHTSSDLTPYLDKPFFVPENAPAPTVLQQLDQQGYLIAIVVDEYGSVSGLITKEDLAEEVVGSITDRRDIKAHYTRSGEDDIIASGKLELDEFENIFGIALQNPGNKITLGGWLTEALGDIPKAGAYYETPHFFFHVLAADPNRIRRLYIRRLHPSKPEIHHG